MTNKFNGHRKGIVGRNFSSKHFDMSKYSDSCMIMTDIAKKLKNASQDVEAKIKTEEDHAQGKPSSETLNKAKVKVRDAL